MKLKILIFLCIHIFISPQLSLCENSSPALNSQAEESALLSDKIINGIENRYNVSGFSAHFFQESSIKAIELTDTASGKLMIKRPGMMRWEYEKPDRQIIITDGNTLWIYRPEDNQVMTGKSHDFFKGGKGACFLSDIKIVRQKFNVSLEKNNSTDNYKLKLLPKEKLFDISAIYLSISKNTFEITTVVTYNSYGDKTRIELSKFQFNHDIDDLMFRFKIPEGADILKLDN